jgi:hypothetical protein
MAQSIARPAEAGGGWRPDEPRMRRRGLLRRLWTALCGVCAEIKEEVRLIVG